jgi:tRNA pseudouridine13 synthase
MQYTIKSAPEDFYVKEIIELKTQEKGSYAYYWLKKANLSTIEAVDIISKKLGIPKKFFNFAGTKDKIAITEQAISIKGGAKKDYDFGNIQLTFIGYSGEPINLGTNSGNYFEIILRDAEKIPKKRNWMINYFDDQRFSDKNVDVGRAIIKKDFKTAAELLKDEIIVEGNDFVGALRQADKKIVKFYINAYQSYLWNKAVSLLFSGKRIKYSLGELNVPDKKPKQSSFPIIGFGTDENKVKEILEEEKISTRDFVIKQMPELSSEGTEREVVVEVKDLKIEDLGSKTIKFSFSLPKGSYATMLVKELFV